MTKEQWIVYLYGIWPDGSMANILIFLIICGITIFTFLTVLYYVENIEKILSIKNKIFIITIIFTIWFLMLKLIPNKNTFIAIISTPTIIKSYKDNNGTIHKSINIIKLILDTTEKRLQKELKILNNK